MANNISFGGGNGGGGSSTLSGLSDVTLTSPTNGQVLKYDGSKWVNGAGGGSSGHTYSTTEQEIGTWIDKKTIYEKTVVASNVTVDTSDWQNIDSISGLDKIICLDGIIYIPSSGRQTSLGQYFNLSYATDGYIKFRCSAWNGLSADVWAVVRYTKTST